MPFLFRRGSIGCLLTLAVICLWPALGMADERNPQYGFAHRVNDWDVIVDALDAGKGGGSVAANGIEFDIGYSTFYKDWIVSHDSFNIAQPASEYLHEWLGELKKKLATGKYDRTFAALWVDIKTPNADDLTKVVRLVRANVPAEVAVIYDLGDPVNYGVGVAPDKYAHFTRGFNAIKGDLRANEGLGVWIANGSGDLVDDMHEVFKAHRIARTVVHNGHALNIDENVLEVINQPQFHQRNDPYHFKKVFTWTNNLSATMEKYINPANKYHTDGQIVGAPTMEWWGHFGDLQDFDDALAKHAGTQRKGVRSLADFWGRSGSDAGSVSAAAPPLPPAAPANVDYNVVVYTGTKSGAGTDSNIYLTITGRKNTIKSARLNGLISGNAFENGQTDRCTLKSLPDVGEITSITVTSDNKYPGSAWYLGWIEVNGVRFNCSDWLETGKLSKTINR